ncbi:hypothetical protein [Gemelliphila palaticanis]|uniref:Uncharacterized protein n=1 Tax=Gemelliphila palaticanis TaxID=81950 RepID=A0ABX2T0P8_9BACL|nr:hypothetical protein [Gemella palaticanis]MBF0714656.1 hypothetical protein [Gemella palaticanis]NYS46586.1 hypothetical protein [Gemella palaticanis]
MTKYSQGRILILSTESPSHVVNCPNLTTAVNNFINKAGIIARDIQYKMSSSTVVEGYSPTVIHSVCIVFDSFLTDDVIEKFQQEAYQLT